MVDLNRRISVTQARQGGFSAHLLPGAVGYEYIQIIIYSDGAATRCTESGVTLGPDNVNPWTSGSSLEANWNTGPIMYSSGGPFDEPYFRYLHKVRAAGAPLVVGTSDYTWEGWFRQKENAGLTFWRILTQYSNPDEPYNGPGYYVLVYSTGSFDNPSYRIDVFGGDNIIGLSTPGINWGVGTNIDFTTFSNWIHIAAARRNGELRFWCNGARITGAPDNPNLTAPLPIGENYTSSIMQHLGVDVGQMRLTKDRAIYWDDNFTPPTAPFFTPPA